MIQFMKLNYIRNPCDFYPCRSKSYDNRKRYHAVSTKGNSRFNPEKNVELEFKNIGKLPKIAMGHNPSKSL